MKTAKLVVGIFSIVISVLVGFQSCAAGMANTLSQNGEVSGSAGLLLAVGLLVAGIVAVCTRSGGKGGYVSTVFYIVPGLLGLMLAGSYADLNIWSVLSIVFGIICFVTTRKQNQ